MNNRLGAIGDVTSGEDALGACGQRFLVDEQAAPCCHLDTGASREERGIRRLANGYQHDVTRHLELRIWDWHRTPAPLLVRLTERHALAAHTGNLALTE